MPHALPGGPVQTPTRVGDDGFDTSQNSICPPLVKPCSHRWVEKARMSLPVGPWWIASTALTLEDTLSIFKPRRRLPTGPVTAPVGSSTLIVLVTEGLPGLLMSTTF